MQDTQAPMERSSLRLALARANQHDTTPAMSRALEASRGLFTTAHIFCWNRSGAAKPDTESQGTITIERFQRTAAPRSLRILWLMVQYQVWLFIKLLRCRADVVQVLDVESGLPAAVACWLTRSRLIYDVRDPLPFSYDFPTPIRRLVQILDWSVMAASSAFVVPSRWMLSYLGRWAQSGRPVTVVQNTCRDCAEELEEPRAKHNGDRVRIAFLGYLVEMRGARLLMQFCRDRGSAVELVVAGDCRSSELLAELNSIPSIRMLGRLSQFESLQLMKQADLVSLLYDPAVPVNRLFASPNKFFEAMMVGTPVLVSKGMSLAPVVEEFGLGYVAEYGNLTDLYDILKKVRNPEEQAKLRNNCRNYYLNYCDLSGEMQIYRGFYEDVLKRCA